MNKSRLEAFSDGVIAIIITIMVLEIKVPHGVNLASLVPLAHVFLSYALSFIFVGIYWGNHHHLLHTVKSVNAGMIWANLNLLFWLSLIPFTTGWMGENAFAPYTVITYAVNLLVCGIAFCILQLTVQRSHESTPDMQTAYANLMRKGIFSAVCYLISIPLALVNTLYAGAVILLVSLVWLIPDKKIEKAVKEE